jgi:hypothetical protein
VPDEMGIILAAGLVRLLLQATWLLLPAPSRLGYSSLAFNVR